MNCRRAALRSRRAGHREAQLAGVWEFVRREIARGRQAYVLYPVIEESKQELKAATAEYERLAKPYFRNCALGCCMAA